MRDSRASSASRVDWSGQWPPMMPVDFLKWLLERALIYIWVALGVTVLFLFIAAKLAGYSFEAYGLILVCVILVVSRKISLHNL